MREYVPIDTLLGTLGAAGALTARQLSDQLGMDHHCVSSRLNKAFYAGQVDRDLLPVRPPIRREYLWRLK